MVSADKHWQALTLFKVKENHTTWTYATKCLGYCNQFHVGSCWQTPVYCHGSNLGHSGSVSIRTNVWETSRNSITSTRKVTSDSEVYKVETYSVNINFFHYSFFINLSWKWFIHQYPDKKNLIQWELRYKSFILSKLRYKSFILSGLRYKSFIQSELRYKCLV